MPFLSEGWSGFSFLSQLRHVLQLPTFRFIRPLSFDATIPTLPPRFSTEGEEEVFPEKNDCAGISCWEKSSFRYESRPWLLDPIDRANVNAKSKEEKQREEKEMFSVREFRKKGGLVLL